MSPIIRDYDGHSPKIHPTSWIAPNASLIGQVSLADNTCVMFGASLRADMDRIEIGEGTNIQDNVTLHTDFQVPTILGKNISVGHNAVVHGCTIEDDCLIGMGAVVLNNAVIGKGSLIAAGTVVLEGTVIPPNSLVAGVPGKVRRELSEEERAGIVQNAANYVKLSRNYLADDAKGQTE